MERYPEEKRAVYRSTPDSEDLLQVTLTGADGSPVSGEIIVVSSLAIEFILAGENAPVIGLGEHVVLTMHSPNLPEPLEALAETVSRTELGGERKYAFRFDQQVVLRNAALQRLFNRRVSLRINPKNAIKVRLRLPDNDTAQILPCLHCLDIAATGIGLRTVPGLSFREASEMDQRLKYIDQVEVAFALPGGDESLTLAARIINRSLHVDNFEYGLKFDPEHTVDFVRHQDAIVDYILRRQEEQFLEMAGRPSLSDLIPLVI